jgi:hypothetical protein
MTANRDNEPGTARRASPGALIGLLVSLLLIVVLLVAGVMLRSGSGTPQNGGGVADATAQGPDLVSDDPSGGAPDVVPDSASPDGGGPGNDAAADPSDSPNWPATSASPATTGVAPVGGKSTPKPTVKPTAAPTPAPTPVPTAAPTPTPAPTPVPTCMAVVTDSGTAQYFRFNDSHSAFIGVWHTEIAKYGNGYKQSVLKNPVTETITSGYSRSVYIAYGAPHSGYWVYPAPGFGWKVTC